jgi:hypothetical protein
MINKAPQRANLGTFVIVVASGFNPGAVAPAAGKIFGAEPKARRHKGFFLWPIAASIT